MRAFRPSPSGLVLGYLLDRAVGDPRRFHPVAGLGGLAASLEAVTYADTRTAGVVHCALCVGAAVAVGAGTGALAADRPAMRVAFTAAATWAALGGTTLTRVGTQVADALDDDDLAGARGLVPSLCARDPDALDAAGICRAATESVAENTSDATVGPLVWGALAGVPGIVGYRTANTLDAMVGYRNDRYRRFGWCSARVDDALNLLPARVSGMLVALLGPDRAGAVRTWRRDASAHPSPNAGVVEAAFAGALGLRLGGRTVYPHRVEQRPVLGDGHPPTTADLAAAVRLSRRVQVGAVVVAAALAWARVRAAESLSRRSVR
ncbi:cobalamin biosynthesis protein [Gordonia sp. NPDC003950]